MAKEIASGSRGSTIDQTVTFNSARCYPFHGNVHFSIGMAGVVWVQ